MYNNIYNKLSRTNPERAGRRAGAGDDAAAASDFGEEKAMLGELSWGYAS